MGTLDDVRYCENCGDYFVIDNEYGIHYCEPPKKRRFWMSKKKDQDVKGDPRKDGHHPDTIINQSDLKEQKSELLVLQSIVDIDSTSKEFPVFITQAITVRADAIDLIELDKAATRWTSNPEPERRSIYDYGFLRMYHTFWYPAEWTDCIKITLAAGQEYKINTTMGDLKARIDQAS
jgi:hypothetical protein